MNGWRNRGSEMQGIEMQAATERYQWLSVSVLDKPGRRFVARRPPRTNGVRLTRSKVPSEEPNRRAIREARSRVIVKLDVLARELGCRYGARFLSQRYRRRRASPWEKRARFASLIPDVVGTQEAGRDGSLSPSTRRGPEHHPVCGTAKTLRRAAAASGKWASAP
jgi:hypothetical protein